MCEVATRHCLLDVVQGLCPGPASDTHAIGSFTVEKRIDIPNGYPGMNVHDPATKHTHNFTRYTPNSVMRL